MTRLLLHICCAPCSTWSIERLRGEYDVTCLFYNPNIQPQDEHDLRLSEAGAYCSDVGVDLLEGSYDVAEWQRAVRGHEDDPEGGDRCRICFALRVDKTARKAIAEGFEAFTTTLTISPHKDAETINAVGAEISERVGIPFIALNLKKQEGFRKSVEMSRAHDLHRQDFCGCLYSRRSGPDSIGQKI